jgi:chromate transporter
MLLPGPEAQQLAIYIGWSLHGTWGGGVAGGVFVLPAAVILWLYVSAGNLSSIQAIVYGLQPAVVAIVAIAILRIARKALRNAFSWLVAALAFVAIFFFKTPFGLIILAAASLGLIGSHLVPSLFSASNDHNPSPERPQEQDRARSTWRMLRIGVVSLGLWMAPIVVAGIGRGWNDILVEQGMFFSKAALITFGGAYPVLPYSRDRQSTIIIG